MNPTDVKALTFDVFGTVTQWRASVIAEAEAIGSARGVHADWPAFVDAWRAGYGPAMNRVRTGELPWTNIDALHRMNLDRLLVERGIDGFSEEDKVNLNLAWHRLKPWPDAVNGLTRLKRGYIVATLSNGNVRLLVDMAKFAGLPWDCIFSAEMVQHYKSDKETYLMASGYLGLRPDEVMMVACHKGDLRGAQRAGLRAAFVPRPLEYGPDRELDLTPDPEFDMVATDFEDLARQLGL
jgi:2-haloacid dehalogenase